MIRKYPKRKLKHVSKHRKFRKKAASLEAEDPDEMNIDFEKQILQFHLQLYHACFERDRKRNPDRMIV